MDNNQQIREEMSKIQTELEQALKTILEEFGKKLKDKERQEIEKEFNEINELLERIKTGLVWIAFFGKTSVGKSALFNSLVGYDIAKVGVQHDLTKEVFSHEKAPWKILDVPGIMGGQNYEDLALKEAYKAHGHIFVIDGQPYGDELESFDKVHKECPNTPKIVFVNKWSMNSRIPKADREIIRSEISAKMGKYVKSPEYIIYGDAMRYDEDNDVMVRQDVPELLNCLYESAGTLGAVMNILDPANRASKLNNDINKRILEIRLNVARKIISRFGTAAALGILVPAATVTVFPVLLTTMVFTICKIMGKQITKRDAGKIMWACLKILGVNAVLGSTAILLTDAATTALTPVGGAGLALAGLASIGGIGWYCYSQTVKLGELTLIYIANDFSWGDKTQKEILENCQKRVDEIYIKLKPQER